MDWLIGDNFQPFGIQQKPVGAVYGYGPSRFNKIFISLVSSRLPPGRDDGVIFTLGVVVGVVLDIDKGDSAWFCNSGSGNDVET